MTMALRAPAKINWTLEVLGQRPDGYHEVRTVLQTIDLCDTVTLESALDLALEVRGAAIDGGSLPAQDNLAYRAARLLQQRSGSQQGASIILDKAIPAGCGLGGGSSDAAAVLMGLNRLWGLNLSGAELAALAAELGSDVPFFLFGGTALATGRGEKVQPLPPARQANLVLAFPPLLLPGKTRRLYALLTPDHYGHGAATERLCQRLARGDPIADGDLYNAFEIVAALAFPELARWQAALVGVGALKVHLAGSGPALFTLVPDAEAGQAICQRARRIGLTAVTVATLADRTGA